MSLAFENPDCIVLLDEPIGRRAAHMVGIKYWGTLKILLEAKSHGLTESIAPYVDRLGDTGLWIAGETRQRILKLAGEGEAAPEPEISKSRVSTEKAGLRVQNPETPKLPDRVGPRSNCSRKPTKENSPAPQPPG